MVIIIVKYNQEDQEHAVGPFTSGEEATRYGFAHLNDHDWYWLTLNAPSDD